MNMNANGFHRVLFKLIGTKSNRAAIGAKVTIRAAGVKQFSEVRGGGSYLSQNDLRLHFGLGTAKKMESVEIRWPSGKVETLQNVAADAIYSIVEGAGIRDSKPLPFGTRPPPWSDINGDVPLESPTPCSNFGSRLVLFCSFDCRHAFGTPQSRVAADDPGEAAETLNYRLRQVCTRGRQISLKR